MPTAHPRISTVVERPLFEAIRKLAVRDDVSVSVKTRDLLLEALEVEEDAALDRLVEGRRTKSKRSYSLAEVKAHLRIR